MGNEFSFIPGRRFDPLAQRRLDLQQQAQSDRTRIDAARIEVATMMAAVHAQQQMTAMRNEMVKQRETAAATKEVSQIDTTDPQWREKYSGVMAKYPYAADNKFLNENFTQLGKVNQASVEATYRDLEEKQRNMDASDRLKQATQAHEQEDVLKSNLRSTEDTQKFMEVAAQKGVDASKYITQDHDGNVTHDWAGLAGALSEAKQSVPTPGVLEDYAKAKGELAGVRSKYDTARNDAIALQKTNNEKANKPNVPFDESQFQFQDADKLAKARTQVQTLESAFPSLTKLGGSGQSPPPTAHQPSLAAPPDSNGVQTPPQQGQPQSQPTPSPDSAAMNWAKANSKDPRAAKILQLNGGQ